MEGSECLLSPEEVFGATGDMSRRVLARAGKDHAKYDWGLEKEAVPGYLNANLGYSLTTHKAQGSSWPSVLVGIEDSVGGRGGLFGVEGRRFLYTSITRAEKDLKICFL